MRLAAFILALLPAAAASAQVQPGHCVALSAAPERIMPAALDDAPVPAGSLRIRFVGHATFLIETAGGVRIATDYAGFAGPGVTPDVVTMNRAHISHFTPDPDPAIGHVLRGWGAGPEDPADHHLEVGDVLIRNVTTDIRGWSGREADANSIFIFESAGLCLAHLGHLHHEPSDAQYARIGRVDVVMVPVDGGYTMEQAAMIRVMKRLKARLVLPMHWFGAANLRAFLAGMRDDFAVIEEPVPELVVSLDTLPRRPTVMVLAPLGGVMPRSLDPGD